MQTGNDPDVKTLVQYVVQHTERGACRCGKCIDPGPEKDFAGKHTVNVHFFDVSLRGNPEAAEFARLLKAYPEPERLKAGPSYIELGAVLGDQGIALQMIALGELLGLWRTITPKRLGITGTLADSMAGVGYVMMSGYDNAKGA